MCCVQVGLAIVLVLCVFGCVVCQQVQQCPKMNNPGVTVKFQNPSGIKFSIPGTEKGLQFVAFFININKKFDLPSVGQKKGIVTSKKDGLWSYTVPDIQVVKGDIVHYWLYLVYEGVGCYIWPYRSFKVFQPNPHMLISITPGFTTESTTTGPTTESTTDPTTSPTIGPTTDSTTDPTTDPTTDSTTGSTPDPSSGPCKLSLSTHDNYMSACQGQVILEESFNNLKSWRHEIQLGGNQPDDEFMVFTDEPGTSRLENGNLVITPILTEDRYDSSFVESGNLVLKGCTSNVPEYCSRTAFTYLILPPIMSARLTTKNSFTFRYGIVEIVAKLPFGDWIVPEMWLVPKSLQLNQRVVIGLARGNTDIRYHDNNWVLEAGIIHNNSYQISRKTQFFEWSLDYHTYKLIWTPDMMQFLVDDKEIKRFVNNNTPVPTFFKIDDDDDEKKARSEEFFISLGLHVAGNRDFNDDLMIKPWKSTDPKRFAKFWESKDKWQPTWSERSAFRIKSVKVWAI